MSLIQIRNALETALNGISPALATAWENDLFTGSVDTPYQQVFLLSGAPLNPSYGDKSYREVGFLQVNLNYPTNAGAGDATARAELLRQTFYNGAAFSSGGITLTISNTPSIGPGAFTDLNRYILPVKIKYFANIMNP